MSPTQRAVFLGAFLIMGSAVQSAIGAVVSGVIVDWPESVSNMVIGDGTNHVTMYWSINTLHKGWFYGSKFTGDSDVAFASGVNDVQQITSAGSLSYMTNAIGPHCDPACAANGVGDFIVWRNVNTDHYGVLRIDDIDTGGPGFADDLLDGTWWFQTDGSGNFVPEPSTLAGFLTLLAVLPYVRCRR